MSATIEWDSPQGRKRVSKIENGRAFIAVEGSNLQQILPEGELTSEIRRDTANFASRKKSMTVLESERHIEKVALTEKRGLHDFTVGMSSVKARKIEETLDKQQGFSGNVMRRRDFIEQAVRAGAVVGQMRTGRVLEMPSGSFYTEKDVTKIGLDYAEHLCRIAPRF